MHKVAMEMGKWAMEKAKTHGFDNLSAQDWDDLKDCMESVKCAICADKDYRIVEAMDECEQEEKYLGRMGYDRRFYHESGDAATKKRMEDSIKDVFDDMESMVQDVWKDMTPEQKTQYRAKMTQLVQKMQ